MEYTQKRLIPNARAVLSSVVIGVLAISAWVLSSFNAAIALCAGAAIIAGPQAWLAMVCLAVWCASTDFLE